VTDHPVRQHVGPSELQPAQGRRYGRADGNGMTAAQSLRVIRRLVAIDLSTALMYRAEFAMFMISTVLGPAISLMIWRAALANGAALPVDAEYLTTYFVLLGAVSMLTSSWMSGFLAEEIRLGTISRWIVRPGSTHFNTIANNLGEKLIKAVPLAPMIALLWWIFRDSVELPSDPVTWLLFAVSVTGAAVMVFALDIIIGSLAFWIDDVRAIDWTRDLVGAVLRGQAVPLALMPAWSQGFFDLQPFRYTLSFSLELLIGDLSAEAVATGIALQLIYPVATVAGAVWIWRRGLRAYAAVGA
jgi:ABC-2 type transport system permease protein